MKRFYLILTLLAIVFLSVPDFAFAQALHLIGPPLFDKHCTTCHSYTKAAKGTPDAYAIWKMTTESIYAAITRGPAHASLTGPTDDEKRFIAEVMHVLDKSFHAFPKLTFGRLDAELLLTCKLIAG